MKVFIGIFLSTAISLIFNGSAGPRQALAQDRPAGFEATEVGGVYTKVASVDLIKKGKRLYKRKCGACHSPDHNRVGPKHRGIYGQQAGTVSGFRYSAALQSLDIVWTERSLDTWLMNPTAMAKGTSMGFRVKEAGERRAIIAYLKSLGVPTE